ncbi:MAG: preprotein translocase subunit SecE [Bacilli bacterium]
MKKLRKFLLGVKKEMTKVRWPNKKEMITYSAATICFVLFFALFFTITDFTLAGIGVLFK